jgi:hypothetical protein
MKLVFGTISAAFGAIPGLLAFMAGLGVPPGENKLFGAVIESLGTLTLLILWGNRGRLKQIPLRALTKQAVVVGIAGLAFAVSYLVIYQICVVTCPLWDTVLFPLWLTGRLAWMVATQGGRSNALCHFATSVYQETQNHPISLAVTLTLMIVIYAAVSTCLTVAFGLFAVRAASTRLQNAPSNSDNLKA